MGRRGTWGLVAVFLGTALLFGYLDGVAPEEIRMGRVLSVHVMPGSYHKGSLQGGSPGRVNAVVLCEGQTFSVDLGPHSPREIGDEVMLKVKRGRYTGKLYVLGAE